jgi:hypothetical protein
MCGRDGPPRCAGIRMDCSSTLARDNRKHEIIRMDCSSIDRAPAAVL